MHAARSLAQFIDPSIEVPSRMKVRTMTIRVPLDDYAYIEAISSQSSLSRSAVAVKLISAGIESTLNVIDESPRAHLEALQDHIFQELNALSSEDEEV